MSELVDLPRVVWVTGASRGIGRAVAMRCAEEGYAVVASGRSVADLDSLHAEATRNGWTLLPLECDVRSSDAIDHAYNRIIGQFGRVDVLVNNAGVTRFASFLSTSVEEFDELTSTNLRGAFLCTRAVLPGMIEQGGGDVVMILSMATRQTFPDSSVYAATKSGLQALAEGLRLETRKRGIRVVDVYPGATLTDIWPERVRERHAARMMPAERVAEVISHVIGLPRDAMIEDVVVQPVGGPL